MDGSNQEINLAISTPRFALARLLDLIRISIRVCDRHLLLSREGSQTIIVYPLSRHNSVHIAPPTVMDQDQERHTPEFLPDLEPLQDIANRVQVHRYLLLVRHTEDQSRLTAGLEHLSRKERTLASLLRLIQDMSLNVVDFRNQAIRILANLSPNHPERTPLMYHQIESLHGHLEQHHRDIQTLHLYIRADLIQVRAKDLPKTLNHHQARLQDLRQSKRAQHPAPLQQNLLNNLNNGCQEKDRRHLKKWVSLKESLIVIV